MAVDLIRKMPMSLEAEQAVLGAILIKPEAFADVTNSLSRVLAAISEV